MKRIILIYSLLSWFVPDLISAETAAAKKITKEWPLEANAAVTFTTKYQDVEVVFWNEDKVRIDINIQSNTDKVSAEELSDRIELKGENTGNNLVISSELKPDKNSWWDRLFGSKKIDISIKSILHVPFSAASLAVRSSYADLKSDLIPVNFTLKSNYGDIKISELKKNSSISASYSDIAIGKADNIDVSSNYGDIVITDAGQLKISSAYSDITIQKLERSLVSSNTYGDIKILHLAKDFSSVKCSSVYSNIEIGINGNFPLQADVQAKNGDVSCKGVPWIKIQDENENGGANFKAKTKSSTASSPSITITSTYGDVIFKNE
jgi:hypothetical protein